MSSLRGPFHCNDCTQDKTVLVKCNVKLPFLGNPRIRDL